MNTLSLLSCGVLACAGMSLGHAKTLQVYILTGQSNSLGAVKGTPASPELLEQYKSDGSTRFWHHNFNKGTGTAVDVTPGPSTAWGDIVTQICNQPNNTAATYNCMGPEYGFAAVMERKGWLLAQTGSADATATSSSKDPNTDIGIIKASLDGGANTEWVKGQNSYNTIVKTVQDACANALANGYDKVEIVGVMYLQGESNSNPGNDVAAKFTQFLTDLKTDIDSSDAAKNGTIDTAKLGQHQAIVGEQATWGSTNVTDSLTHDVTGGSNGNESSSGDTRTQQLEMTKTNERMNWVYTRDLAKIDTANGDNLGVHYNGKSQLTIGARYAYEAAKLAGYDVGTVRSDNFEAKLNSPDAWENGKLPTDTVAVWDLNSSAKDSVVSDAAGTNATLYGIKVEDPYLNTVTIRGVPVSGSTAPTAADGHLILGQGGIDIAAGKNLRIASVLQIDGPQTWNIAGGSTLSITGSKIGESNGGNHVLTLITGTGDVTVNNSTIESAPQSVAKVKADIHINNSADTPFNGNWTLNKGVEVTMNGKTPAGGTGAGNGWGTGTVTMNGATILAGWESQNNTWNNRFVLGQDTQNSFGGETNTAGKTLELTGEISGAGTLVKTTQNTLKLTHANTYTGGTIIQAGTLLITVNTALGTGSVTVENGGTLDLNNLSVANTIHLAGGNVLNWANNQAGATMHIDSDYTFATPTSGSAAFTLKENSVIGAGNSITVQSGNTVTAVSLTVQLANANRLSDEPAVFAVRSLTAAPTATAAINMQGGTLTLQGDLAIDMSAVDSDLANGTYRFQLASLDDGQINGLESDDNITLTGDSANWSLLSYDNTNGILTAQYVANVPEPGAACLVLLSLCGFCRRRKR